MSTSNPYRAARAAAGRLSRKRLVDGPLAFNEDGLATRHGAAFLKDPDFIRAYAAGDRTGSWGGASIRWRAHVACWAAQQATHVEGDFVECGVNRGGLSRTIVELLDPATWKDRKFYLLDTFRGLVDEQISDADRAVGRRAGGYDECYDAVRETFAPFSFVRIIRGTVPDTLDEVTSERIAFLSLDMNCVPPEIAAAERFWPRLSKGACVVLDDYCFHGHEPQRRAFDAFAEERGVRVLTLPTGQGLLVKT